MVSDESCHVAQLYHSYKQKLDRDEEISQLRARVFAVVIKKQLTSLMNDTKWLELQLAINELRFPPPYVCRCITDEEGKEEGALASLSCIPRYMGDWSNYYEEGMPVLFNIEWIKVHPRIGIFRGRLVKDEVIDETAAFRKILNRLYIPYEEENNIFTVYGYKA